jgi:hypothetical protein
VPDVLYSGCGTSTGKVPFLMLSIVGGIKVAAHHLGGDGLFY